MWKHGSVVLTVGHLIVRKDLRISVVNGTSLFGQCLASFYNNFMSTLEGDPSHW